MILTNIGDIVVEHRNHMAAMTSGLVPLHDRSIVYDFRTSDSYNQGGSGQKEILPGVWALFGGDGSQTNDGEGYDINGKDKNEWRWFNGTFSEYHLYDFNMDGDVNGFDKSFWSLNNGIFSTIER